MVLALAILLSYLAGSIPAAVWIGRMVRGIDIRQHGSGNAGATNAARVLGVPWGILVGVIDVFKGFAPVFWLGPMAAAGSGLGTAETRLILGIAAIVGHLYPIFAAFRGGKGVLTALGVFAALLPLEAAIATGVWVIVFALTRIVSVGSLVAVTAFVGAVLIRRFVLHVPIPNALVVAALLVAALVFFTHRSNLRRLRHGDEARFGRRQDGP
ncbi:MAG: glycerol-3-phosphate 1-O-acyltransferase PlsY [Candidatus Zixiibacteriota bacterium]